MPRVRTAEQVREAHMRELDKNDRWKRENTKLIQMRITYSSGIPALLDKVQADTGLTPTRYVRKALINELQRDGYIAEIPENSDEED